MTWLAALVLHVGIRAGVPEARDLETTYVGFFERGGLNAEEANAEGGAPFPRVRVVFEKRNGVWEIVHAQAHDLPSLRESPNWYPSPIRWTVVSDGKALGEVVTKRPEEGRSYGSIGLQLITSSTLPAPVMASPESRDPSWWPGNTQVRPLVVVTGESWRDPDRWRRNTPPPETLKDRFIQLRQLLGSGLPVTLEEGGETESISFRCDDRSLKLARAYRSADGRGLLSVELTGCSPPAESGIDYPITYMFLVDGKHVTPLGSDLSLVDAGDYDGDGRSEVLFGRSLHNADGYFLFSHGFTSRCDFVWGYH